MFGYVLDALVTSGILGSMIVFLLIKTTQYRTSANGVVDLPDNLRRAWLLLLALTGAAAILSFGWARGMGYAVSFLFWFALH